MENNRKGNGIFLGIVSVATLVVAIIGATFAYFSATTQSNEDAVNLTAYEFNLSMSVSPIFPSGANKLIPLDPDNEIAGAQSPNNTNLMYALNATGRSYESCIDDNGLQVCALYEVRITNQNTNPITLGGQIRTVNNTPGKGGEPLTHLTYQSVKSASGVATNHDFSLLTSSDDMFTGTKAVGTVAIDGEIDGITDIDSIYVPSVNDDIGYGKGIGVAYVLIYLNDVEDQSTEMGASYTGQLIYSSSEGAAGSTLTGTFRVSGT